MTALGTNDVWHPLEMVVTPDEVTATINGSTMKLSSQVLSAESLWAKLAWQRGFRPQDAMIQNFHPKFTPKGGLGLVINNKSAASIRRVIVTPQPVVP